MSYRSMILGLLVAMAPLAAFGQTAAAPTPAPANPPEVDACKASGLIALREQNPSVKDIDLDLDSVRIIKTTSKIEEIAIRTVVLADVYVQKKRTGKPQNFVCIIGDKGKVLLTLFTNS